MLNSLQDFVGPYEAFDLSLYLLKTGRVVTIAETLEPIVCSNGMEVKPQYTFDAAPALDVVLVPGANDLAAALASERAKDKSIKVMPEMRYVRDGNIVTSQGVSAGIDMALWLLGQLHNPEHAREVRKVLYYDPAPPYMAEV